VEINKTDKRLAKLWRQGNRDIQSLAKKIGRPGNTIRVVEGLLREGIWEVLEEDNENQNPGRDSSSRSRIQGD